MLVVEITVSLRPIQRTVKPIMLQFNKQIMLNVNKTVSLDLYNALLIAMMHTIIRAKSMPECQVNHKHSNLSMWPTRSRCLPVPADSMPRRATEVPSSSSVVSRLSSDGRR